MQLIEVRNEVLQHPKLLEDGQVRSSYGSSISCSHSRALSEAVNYTAPIFSEYMQPEPRDSIRADLVKKLSMHKYMRCVAEGSSKGIVQRKRTWRRSVLEGFSPSSVSQVSGRKGYVSQISSKVQQTDIAYNREKLCRAPKENVQRMDASCETPCKAIHRECSPSAAIVETCSNDEKHSLEKTSAHPFLSNSATFSDSANATCERDGHNHWARHEISNGNTEKGGLLEVEESEHNVGDRQDTLDKWSTLWHAKMKSERMAKVKNKEMSFLEHEASEISESFLDFVEANTNLFRQNLECKIYLLRHSKNWLRAWRLLVKGCPDSLFVSTIQILEDHIKAASSTRRIDDRTLSGPRPHDTRAASAYGSGSHISDLQGEILHEVFSDIETAIAVRGRPAKLSKAYLSLLCSVHSTIVSFPDVRTSFNFRKFFQENVQMLSDAFTIKLYLKALVIHQLSARSLEARQILPLLPKREESRIYLNILLRLCVTVKDFLCTFEEIRKREHFDRETAFVCLYQIQHFEKSSGFTNVVFPCLLRAAENPLFWVSRNTPRQCDATGSMRKRNRIREGARQKTSDFLEATSEPRHCIFHGQRCEDFQSCKLEAACRFVDLYNFEPAWSSFLVKRHASQKLPEWMRQTLEDNVKRIVGEIKRVQMPLPTSQKECAIHSLHERAPETTPQPLRADSLQVALRNCRSPHPDTAIENEGISNPVAYVCNMPFPQDLGKWYTRTILRRQGWLREHEFSMQPFISLDVNFLCGKSSGASYTLTSDNAVIGKLQELLNEQQDESWIGERSWRNNARVTIRYWNHKWPTLPLIAFLATNLHGYSSYINIELSKVRGRSTGDGESTVHLQL